MELVADTIRITRPGVARALEDRNPTPIAEMALRAVAAGATALDINAGPLTRRAREGMHFLVDAVSAVTPLPLFIDTTNPEAMAAGLERGPNPKIINGISLEPEKLERILPLAVKHQVPVVGFLLDEKSRVGQNREERLEMAAELEARCYEAGLDPDCIIFDPVVPPLAWDNGLAQAREVVETLILLPQMLGRSVKTIAGISNLTTGGPDPDRRQLLESTYLSMLAGAGLTHALMDTDHAGTVDVAAACRLLKGDGIFSWASVPGGRD